MSAEEVDDNFIAGDAELQVLERHLYSDSVIGHDAELEVLEREL